jgi:predicted transcriptional regulator
MMLTKFALELKSNIQSMAKLSNTTKRLLRESNELTGKVADKIGVSISSMYRLLRDNDIRLTTVEAMKIYKEDMAIPEDEILEPETTAA